MSKAIVPINAPLRGCDCDDKKKKGDCGCDCDCDGIHVVHRESVLVTGITEIRLTRIDTTDIPQDILDAICPPPECCNVNVIVCNELIATNLCEGIKVYDQCDPDCCRIPLLQ